MPERLLVSYRTLARFPKAGIGVFGVLLLRLAIALHRVAPTRTPKIALLPFLEAVGLGVLTKPDRAKQLRPHF